ncbi:MAG: PD40 domain-containing protein [Paludibacteraceae bacterium]|nr:PD40 domain-containing protein [Paludibacteraceae bacterium]
MKKIFLIAALATALIANAQVLEVASVEKIATPENLDAKVAGIAPDGSYLLITTGTNEGLQRFDMQTGETSVITTAAGAGYNAKITDDGKDVIYRETNYGSDRLRLQQLVRQTLATMKREVLVLPTRNLQGISVHRNTISVVNNRNIKRVAVNSSQKTEEMPVLSISNGQLMITRGGNTTQLSPNGTDKSYIWPSVSPDMKHITYYVAGEGCYVAGIDGSNPQYIARQCRAAKWLDDNTLVAMADRDNGEVVTESSIVVYTIDGRHQTLTDNSVIAMYPYASADGKRIVFSTDRGEAYMINVK